MHVNEGKLRNLPCLGEIQGNHGITAENDEDIILDLQIMKVSRRSMSADSTSLAPPSGTQFAVS